MTNAALTQFLIDVTRGNSKREFMSAPLDVLTASGLPEVLRDAVTRQDIGMLWLAGAHPMALLYFSRTCGWSNERYYLCIENAEATRAAPAAADPGAASGRPQMHPSIAPHAQ